MNEPQTEIKKASELGSVIQRIFELRYPDRMPQYRKELAKYNRQRGQRAEVETTGRTQYGDIVKTVEGFKFERFGEEFLIKRPTEPRPRTFVHFGYDRYAGSTSYARQGGLLADALYNRDIRVNRVDQYEAEMEAGRWTDLLSDPITITDDGHVVNGQHRLAAASRVDWDKVGNDPEFLVVWGVAPEEALLADGSRRTAKDESVIAKKLVLKGA